MFSEYAYIFLMIMGITTTMNFCFHFKLENKEEVIPKVNVCVASNPVKYYMYSSLCFSENLISTKIKIIF